MAYKRYLSPLVLYPPHLKQKEFAELILSRREGESIFISLPGSEDTIEVRVMKAGAQVRLGIDAPREVGVLREELVQKQTCYDRGWVRPPSGISGKP